MSPNQATTKRSKKEGTSKDAILVQESSNSAIRKIKESMSASQRSFEVQPRYNSRPVVTIESGQYQIGNVLN